ncbi:unnamed protein product, partial [Ceratitis capitata]
MRKLVLAFVDFRRTAAAVAIAGIYFGNAFIQVLLWFIIMTQGPVSKRRCVPFGFGACGSKCYF